MIDELLNAVSDKLSPAVNYLADRYRCKIAEPANELRLYIGRTYVIPRIDRFETYCDTVLLPKLEPHIHRLEVTVTHIGLRIDNVKHTWNYNMGRWESGEPITNAVEIFVAGAISEMQDRLHTKYLDMVDVALSESWDAFNKAAEAFDNSDEHKLIELGDRAITQAGIDFTDWGDEVVRVKDFRGREHNISLTELIGD